MTVKIKDYENFVVESCHLIKDAVKCIEPLLEKDSALTKKDIAKIDRAFVRLALLMKGLAEIIHPTPSTGEIHGLPTEATSGASRPEPIPIHTERPDWDFRPWLKEKILSMSGEFDLLMREAEKEFHPDTPLPGEIAGSPNLLFHARYICKRTDTISEMFESGQLKFKDVMVEDDENIEDEEFLDEE